MSTSNPNGGIKLTLDMAIGESSAIESADKGKLQDLATRAKDLNNRLQDIRREQVFQRVCLLPLNRTGVKWRKKEKGEEEVTNRLLKTGTRSRIP